ncbi:Sugar fermentation stimulation protein A [Candidatus Bealeia paramacronuclearis]|uniref:Sugar fermentation stimulation protein homolog n=1 Tax=Candidatus Bealeia paramacronuclearis TaxID=1921001 RepID=A0ABZ2C3C1_9PROT|nr:Sugar fermentation stimulation protein A [Candidatus Bealeia paramacronuclearis]
MEFSPPLHKGILLKRYKRFLADVLLDSGEEVIAHCVNTGAMLGIKDPGTPVYLSYAPSPNRKLSYTWEMAEVEGTLVGANTARPNFLVGEALLQKQLIPFQSYSNIKREAKINDKTRLDFLLKEEGLPDCYVEVKNVHYKKEGLALFPDSVTIRGAKHMDELLELKSQGFQCAVLYVVQRADCKGFGLASEIDPNYAKSTLKAHSDGVEIFAYSCQLTPNGITLAHILPLEF